MFIVYISYGRNSLPSFQYKIQDHESKRYREGGGREWNGRQTDRQRGERRRVVNEGRERGKRHREKEKESQREGVVMNEGGERGREQVSIRGYIFNEPGTCPSALSFRKMQTATTLKRDQRALESDKNHIERRGELFSSNTVSLMLGNINNSIWMFLLYLLLDQWVCFSVIHTYFTHGYNGKHHKC